MSLLDTVRNIVLQGQTSFNNAISDNKGFIRQGQFTPKAELNDFIQSWQQKPSNQISHSIINRILPEKNGVPGYKQLEDIPRINLPRFNFADNQTNPYLRKTLQVPQAALNLAPMMAENVVNIPRDFTVGVVRTGNDMGDMSEGKMPFSMTRLAADYSPTAKSILTTWLMKSGNAASPTSWQQAITRPAITGAKVGGGYGFLDSLEQQRDLALTDPQQAWKNVSMPTIKGISIGAFTGGIFGATSYGFQQYGPQIYRAKVPGQGEYLIKTNKAKTYGYGTFIPENYNPNVNSNALQPNFNLATTGNFSPQYPMATNTANFLAKISPSGVQIKGSNLPKTVFTDLQPLSKITAETPKAESETDNNWIDNLWKSDAEMAAEKSSEPNVQQQNIENLFGKQVNQEPIRRMDTDPFANRPVSKLKNIISYDNELRNLGFSSTQRKAMSSKDAQVVFSHNMTPDQWDTAVKNAEGSGMSARERIQLIDELKEGRDPTLVAHKVNIIDYLRTPKNVFDKIGLKPEFDFLSKQWLKYKQELPNELKQIEAWRAEVPSIESSKKIFQWLDGKSVQLSPAEQQVATKIKDYLGGWADKLDIPQDKRISDYITHIFPPAVTGKEFDPDLANLIYSKVPGSVYDPFLMQRGGKPEYIEDVWKALFAYVKRATRKYNVDPALSKIQKVSSVIPMESQKYIQRYLSNVNMRPSELDTLIDNFIKSTPIGYRLGQRPMTNISRNIRSTIYRGAIGLNPGTAIKNLSQVSNTYAELGEKYTITGLIDAVKNGDSDELIKSGIFEDSFINDRDLTTTKKILQLTDGVLFHMFERAEKFNRKTAYWGAKRQALNKGLGEEAAKTYARQVVEKTQFKFGAIDSPVAMSMAGDTGSLFTQFKTFALKQAEFLTDKIIQRQWAGIIRFIVAMWLLQKTVGEFLGWNYKDMIIPDPTGQSPFTQVATNIPKAFSSDDQVKAEARKQLKNSAWLAMPGGGQIRKSIEGYNTWKKGYSESPKGLVRFPVEQTPKSAVQNVLFGQWASQQAKDYVKNDFPTLGEKQSELVKSSQDKLKVYQEIMEKRESDKLVTQAKQLVEKTGQGVTIEDKYIYIDPDDGETKTLDTNFEAKKPELTGLTELDKKLITQYKADLTKQGTIATKMYELGLITKDEAENRLNVLKTKRAKLGGTKKAKKITFKKIGNMPKIKIAASKKKNPVMFTIKKSPNLKIAQPKSLKNLIDRI